MALLAAAPLLLRRRAPFVAPLVAAAGGIAFTLVDPEGAYDTSTMFFVLLLMAWAAGSLPDARQAGIVLSATLVTGWLVVRGRGKDGAFDRRYRYTDTWVQRSGRWQVVAAHDYLAP